MAEVKIDEVYVTAISKPPPEVTVDEIAVTAIMGYEPTLNIDRLYARSIYPTPASITFDSLHAGAVRTINLPTRFKSGYKKEVLDTLANVLGISLSVDNYDLELRGLNQSNPRSTNLRLIARKASTYRRYSDVIYERADANRLASLIDLDRLKPSEVNPLRTTAQIVDRINQLVGTTLTDLDFVEEATPTGQDRYLTAKDTSFYFHPGTKLNVGRLDATARATEIDGLDRSDYSGIRKPYRIHSTDWSAYVSDLNNAGTVISSTTANALVAAMTALTPGHGFTNSPYAQLPPAAGYGIRNAPCQVLTLPAVTDAPVDNSGYYKRALVIDLADSPWFANFRWLIFHYNV